MWRFTPECLIFEFPEEKIVPLHMMFVFFGIDVLFLDKHKRIVEIKQDFRPWMFYTPKNKAMWIVEAGKIKDVNVGDVIEF